MPAKQSPSMSRVRPPRWPPPPAALAAGRPRRAGPRRGPGSARQSARARL